MNKIVSEFFEVNGIKLHTKIAGNKGEKAIIFLHGFPEFWYGWKRQIPFFVDQGFYVIIPDLRGYNLSSKPEKVRSYVIENTTRDIAMLIKHLELGSVYLVGHDWGGMVAWALAMEFPDLLKKVIVLNLPHPQVAFKYIKTHPSQMIKSSYIGAFQLPLLPEVLSALFNYGLLEKIMKRSSKPGTFSEEDFIEYKKAWGQPGALRAMINWYRAITYSKLRLNKMIAIPSLLIWSKKDQFLSEEMATLSMEKCEQGSLEVLEDATHWVHHEKPEVVNRLILNFITS